MTHRLTQFFWCLALYGLSGGSFGFSSASGQADDRFWVESFQERTVR